MNKTKKTPPIFLLTLLYYGFRFFVFLGIVVTWSTKNVAGLGLFIIASSLRLMRSLLQGLSRVVTTTADQLQKAGRSLSRYVRQSALTATLHLKNGIKILPAYGKMGKYRAKRLVKPVFWGTIVGILIFSVLSSSPLKTFGQQEQTVAPLQPIFIFDRNNVLLNRVFYTKGEMQRRTIYKRAPSAVDVALEKLQKTHSMSELQNGLFVYTTFDLRLSNYLQRVLLERYGELESRDIADVAVLVTDSSDQTILTFIGTMHYYVKPQDLSAQFPLGDYELFRKVSAQKQEPVAKRSFNLNTLTVAAWVEKSDGKIDKDEDLAVSLKSSVEAFLSVNGKSALQSLTHRGGQSSETLVKGGDQYGK